MDSQVLKKIETMIRKTNCAATKEDLKILLQQLFELNQSKSRWILR